MEEQNQQADSSLPTPILNNKLELGIVVIFSKSWQYFSANVGLIISLIFLSAVVIIAPIALIGATMFLFTDLWFLSIILGVVFLIVAIILSIRIATATTLAAIRIIGYNETPTLRQIWQQSSSLTTKYLLTTILLSLTIIGGLILLIVPGVIFGLWYCLAIIVALDQKIGATAAMSESKRLVRGHMGTIFGFFAIYFLITVVIPLIPIEDAPLVVSVVSMIVNFILNIILIFALPYIYFALKQEKDSAIPSTPQEEVISPNPITL